MRGGSRVQIEEVIGANIKAARETDGLSQRALGERLGEYLKVSWAPQNVSVAEQGGRSFTAVEILALAVILERPIARFFAPPRTGVTEIEMPSGEVVGLGWEMAFGRGYEEALVVLEQDISDRMWEAMSGVVQGLKEDQRKRVALAEAKKERDRERTR
jgi:transcriptional regulator with XRE-family HTH domain